MPIGLGGHSRHCTGCGEVFLTDNGLERYCESCKLTCARCGEGSSSLYVVDGELSCYLCLESGELEHGTPEHVTAA